MKNRKFKQNSKDKRQKTFFSKEICVRACAYGNNFVSLQHILWSTVKIAYI